MSSPSLTMAARQHEGTGNLAVNDTLSRRCITRALFAILGRFRSRRKGCCVQVSKDIVIKTKPMTHLTEAATMRFVKENTSSVPVPHVHCAFVHDNQAVIVMGTLPGRLIGDVWLDLSELDRVAIFKQLERMFRELRALPSPTGKAVESCTGGSLYDLRLVPKGRFGPFKTIQEFHFWLRNGLREHERPGHVSDDEWERLKAMVRRQDGPWDSPVFTHGCLSMLGVLVDDSRCVTGILDWDFAGWYPAYWEYTALHYAYTIKEWLDPLKQFLHTSTEDLEMDTTRQKWRGGF